MTVVAQLHRVALPGEADGEAELLAIVAGRMSAAPSPLRIPSSGLPGLVNRADARTRKAFTLTPAPLIESWRVARHLERATAPGDVVVVADRRGLAGVFALEQAMGPASQRRRVVVVGGYSTALTSIAAIGQIDGLEGDVASEIDWELVAYRFADAVVTCSPMAVTALGRWGVDAQLLDPRDDDDDAIGALPRALGCVALPEPFSRPSRSPTILRGVTALEVDHAVERIVVSDVDVEDGIWSGSTWEAARGVRATLGDRLVRGDTDGADVLVLGRPLDLPELDVRAQVEAGTAVVVPADSAAALWWPSAPRWTDEESLARALSGRGDALPMPASERAPVLGQRLGDPGRASRVSVGVPIFRDVRFLDEAVRSLLAQSQSPHEILLLDDGSHDPGVDEALARWAVAEPGLVRVLRQPNLGVCAARNRLLAEMRGDAFVLLDADDLLESDFIEACATALRGDISLTAVATWTAFFGDYEGVEAKPPFDARVGRRENPIVSTCVLMDMAVRDQGVRFDPELAWIFCEDWDVWAKTVATGGRFGLIPRPLARHRVHSSSGGFQRTSLALAVGRARATAHLREI